MAKKRNPNNYLHLDENPLVPVGAFLREDTKKILEEVVDMAIKDGDLCKLREARAMQREFGFID
ncbi:MAG: hypothetical protein C4575_10490 [Desulforudis sp.]|jgi:hypothetical protein|nr:MAG: hypothetical protein C4575_10490 [Desulforudis sp.]